MDEKENTTLNLGDEYQEFNLSDDYSDLSDLDPSSEITDYFGESNSDFDIDLGGEYDFFDPSKDYTDISDLLPGSEISDYFGSDVKDISYGSITEINPSDFFDYSEDDGNVTELPSIFNGWDDDLLPTPIDTRYYDFGDFETPKIRFENPGNKIYGGINYDKDKFVDMGPGYLKWKYGYDKVSGILNVPDYNLNQFKNLINDYKGQLDSLINNLNKQIQVKTTKLDEIYDFQKEMAEKYYNLALDQFNEKKREFDEMLKLQQQLIDQKNQEIQLGWQYYNMSLEQWKTKLGEIQHLQQVRQTNNDRFLSGD